MTAYYNEFDPFAAAWLRELVKDGLIAPGDVDERSIVEVRPDDLKGYTQCHFFAGIGGWSLALRLAGWDDDRSVWTGSCPCQPFSSAGKQAGHADPRHLWPEWFRLVRQCRPATVFGEQVAAAIGWGWLDLVSTQLEGCGYAVGAAVLPAASVGAPHKRDRLWFVGALGKDAECVGRRGRGDGCDTSATRRAEPQVQVTGLRPARGVADPDRGRFGQHGERHGDPPQDPANRHPCGRDVGGCDTHPWADLLWLPCRDGKARPTESTLFGLVAGLPAELGYVRHPGAQEGTEEAVAWPTPRGQDSYERRNRKTMERIAAEGGDMTLVTAAKVFAPPPQASAWASPGAGDDRSANPSWQSAADRHAANGIHKQMMLRDQARLVNTTQEGDGDHAYLSPLVHGATHRVGRLRGYGNAINPYVAAAFIQAYLGD